MRTLLPAPLLLAALLVALVGCGEEASTGTPAPAAPTTAAATTAPPAQSAPAPRPQPADGICPAELPVSPDVSDRGFGTNEPASSTPSLGDPAAAWVCRYDPVDAGPGPGGNGTTYAWERSGRARAVAPDRLPVLGELLGQLATLPDEQLVCTDDLGPRWLLVLETDAGTVGVVRDSFGCDLVRLTDDVFSTIPGEGTRRGTVPGVLLGPPALAREITRATR